MGGRRSRPESRVGSSAPNSGLPRQTQRPALTHRRQRFSTTSTAISPLSRPYLPMPCSKGVTAYLLGDDFAAMGPCERADLLGSLPAAVRIRGNVERSLHETRRSLGFSRGCSAPSARAGGRESPPRLQRGLPLTTQRRNRSTCDCGHRPSQGMDPSRSRARMASAWSLTSSCDHRSKAHFIDWRSPSRKSGLT
jgi:hypothetical protein